MSSTFIYLSLTIEYYDFNKYILYIIIPKLQIINILRIIFYNKLKMHWTIEFKNLINLDAKNKKIFIVLQITTFWSLKFKHELKNIYIEGFFLKNLFLLQSVFQTFPFSKLYAKISFRFLSLNLLIDYVKLNFNL